MEAPEENAKTEIHGTFRLVNIFVSINGIPLINIPEKVRGRLKMYFSLCLAVSFTFFNMLAQYAYVAKEVANAKTIIDFVGSNFHLAGYSMTSLCKLLSVLYKRETVRHLIVELADIWPVSLKDEEASAIKQECLSSLKMKQNLYIFFNFVGMCFYALTPIAVVIYQKIQGVPPKIGYIFQSVYPFDKTQPFYHGVAYIFEAWAGNITVYTIIGADLLFVTMASHISMLLRLLQVKIRNLIGDERSDKTEVHALIDCYPEIVDVVKVHQRLIKYANDLEDAFSAVNLINVVMSSVNICLVMFNIVKLNFCTFMELSALIAVPTTNMEDFKSRVNTSMLILDLIVASHQFLESWMDLSSKFYVGAVLTQMGMLCWYADDVYRASEAVSDAVYESRWYLANTRCRRALLVVLQRSQKPIYFTTMKFSNITMATYSSILTSAYSYFTLIYSSYSAD